MKNIHVLPTDKPSRLWLTKLGNLTRCHDIKPIKKALGNNVNIYITSDEEIKEGDWYLDTFNNQRIKANQFSDHKHYGNACKKIILTTDQDLIGVQPIDDEFLKWFVKNPSCLYAIVDKEEDFYEIFMPNINIEDEIIIPKEEPKKKHIVMLVGDKVNEEPKQETLEEASLLSRPIHLIWDEGERYDCNEEFREEFKKGAKWQQERSYSEEEVINLLQDFANDYDDIIDIKEWFEKIKKK